MLILHGTYGLLPQYRADIVSFAEALVEQQIAAVIPHYFERTNTEAGLAAFAAMSDRPARGQSSFSRPSSDPQAVC